MEIIAEKREQVGKKAKSLISDRKIPAVIFGKGMDSVSIAIDAHEFAKVFKEAGETSLLDLIIGNKKEKVLVSEVQRDPVTLKPIHIAFHKVDLTHKLTAAIPVEVIGEEANELVKSKAALVLTLMNEISVEALPSDLPRSFKVDVSKLTEIGQGIVVGQLDYDKTKVRVLNYEADNLVVKLESAQMAEELEEVVAATEEEAISKVQASEELTDEEKKAREEEKKKEADKGSKK